MMAAGVRGPTLPGNGSGIAGVGYAGVRILPVTVLGADGLGRDSDIIEGLVWATDNGADVALLAFSASGYSSALQAAVDYAWSKDVVVVAAVGNDGTSLPMFPAGDRGVVGVSSTDQSDALAPSSNYGPSVFLAAPGTGITSLVPGGGTSSVSGTSAAAASVAGAAGLLRAVDPSLTAGAVVGRLARSADAAGSVDQTGNGRLNLARALADTSTAEVQPSGAAPVGDGGPFVGPYVAAGNAQLQGVTTDNSTTLRLAGVLVECDPLAPVANQCSGSATSSSAGSGNNYGPFQFNFSGNSGTFQFRASKAGYQSTTFTVVVTSNNQTVTRNIALTPTNSSPTATTPSFSPASPKTNDLLTASTTTADTDGNNVSVGWTWKVTRGANTCVIATASSPSAAASLRSVSLDLSSSFSTSSCTGATPPATINPAKGDIVIAEATPNDGTVNGSLQSNSVTIANSAPVVTNVVIAPSGPTTNQTITATPTATDADGDTVTFTYQWQKKVGAGAFTNLAGATSASLDLSVAGNGDKTDQLRVLITPNDGTVNGSEFTSSAVTVGNSAPVIDSVAINETSPRTNDVLSVTVTSHDDDGDTVTYSYQWTKNGVDIAGATGSTLNLATAGNGDKNDVIRVRVTPNDGAVNGTAVTSAPVTILNSAPTATVLLTPSSPTTNQTVTANTTTGDADGDTVTLSYVWKVNGTIVAGETGATLNLATAGNGDKNDLIRVEVTPNDGTVNGSTVNHSVTVANSAPVVDSVTIDQASPKTNDTLTVTVTGHDDDGDAFVYSYQWTKNGVDIAGETGSTLNLATAGNGDKSDLIRVRVVATETALGGLASAAVTSSPVTIANSAPVVTLSGPILANEGDTKNYPYTVSDPDGDAFTVKTGFPDCGSGNTLSNATTTTTSGTFDCTFADGPSSSTVRIQVADSDGADSNVSTKAVDIANVKPTVTIVTGATTADEGQTKTYTYTVTDPGADTLTVTESCGANGTYAADATANSFDCTFPDGPASPVVLVSANDGDPTNNVGSDDLTVSVANVAPVIGTITGTVAPVALGGSASVSAPFTDAGTLDTHSCTVLWGDATAAEPGTVAQGSGSGTCNDSHVYTAAGVYTVRVTVTDDDGGSDTEDYLTYVVIYDPNGGFVTGGGWINSPIGAYAPDPTLTGKANFGFVSKYQKGASVPTGNTEFQFHAGNLNFKSTAYEWLVISGGYKAQYKGTGTINGAGSYQFSLTVIDGNRAGGGGVDKFRMRIWGATGLVYDNQVGAGDTADPTTAINGGSIVVHSK